MSKWRLIGEIFRSRDSRSGRKSRMRLLVLDGTIGRSSVVIFTMFKMFSGAS